MAVKSFGSFGNFVAVNRSSGVKGCGIFVPGMRVSNKAMVGSRGCVKAKTVVLRGGQVKCEAIIKTGDMVVHGAGSSSACINGPTAVIGFWGGGGVRLGAFVRGFTTRFSRASRSMFNTRAIFGRLRR